MTGLAWGLCGTFVPYSMASPLPEGHGAIGVVQHMVPPSPRCHIGTTARGPSKDADGAGSPTTCRGGKGCMGMEGLSLHGPSGLQIAFSHGASRGPGLCAPMPHVVETTHSFEDQDFLLASHMGTPNDAIPTAAFRSRIRCRLHHVLRRDRRLLPSFFCVPAGPARVDRGCSWGNRCYGGGHLLALDLQGAFPTRGRVANYIRHTMDDMAPLK